MVNDRSFDEATKPAAPSMLQHNIWNHCHLPESMIVKAAAHKYISGGYVCGLNAFRCCLLMKDYTRLPEKDVFPYTFPLIDLESVRMGPRPVDYAQWMKRWCSSLDCHVYNGSWHETIEFIKKHLHQGNPVIALGSSGCLAHYFPIVGLGNGCVFVLESGGALRSASEEWLQYYMDVRIPTISGYSAFAIVK